MKTITLSGSLRENVGKQGAAELRRQERVPAVLYGGDKQIHFSLTENEAKQLIITPNVYLIDLEISGDKFKTILQESQLHPVNGRILHLDFLQVIENKPIKVKLPILLEGFSRGVRNGGRLIQNFRKLHVVGLEDNLPEALQIDITSLRIGEKIRVSDISVPEIKFLDPLNAVVVGVLTAREIIEEDEDEDEDEEGTEETTESEEGKETSSEGKPEEVKEKA